MKPILFNTEMVRAILDGRKTVTRRVVNAPVLSQVRMPDKVSICANKALFSWNGPDTIGGFSAKQPYRPGDILYVRETWTFDVGDDDEGTGYFAYKADGAESPTGRWRPSIHMPKEAARLFLRVQDVRVEQLHKITHDGISKEGIVTIGSPGGPERINPFFQFKELWDSTIKKADLPRYGWKANPWVWVIEFERISKEEAKKDGEGNG